MSGQALGDKTFDLNGSVGDYLAKRINVTFVQRLHIEVELVSGTWATAVVELLKSGGGAEYYSFSPAIEFTGATRVIDIDVHDAALVNLELTTAEGSAGTARFYFFGDGYDVYQVSLPAGYATRTDDASATITYVGKAATGSVTSAAVWQIQRLTDTGSGLTVEWADGDDSFDNVWDNRASLSYS